MTTKRYGEAGYSREMRSNGRAQQSKENTATAEQTSDEKSNGYEWRRLAEQGHGKALYRTAMAMCRTDKQGKSYESDSNGVAKRRLATEMR